MIEWIGFAFPLVIWALWRLQAFSVQGLRGSMVRLTRGNRAIYHTVSWFGTLLHETSHALVLLLSGHGIRDFNVKSTTGHVVPRRLRRDPVSTLAFAFAALAPQFFVPALVLAAAMFFLDARFTFESYAFLPALTSMAQEVPLRLGRALVDADITNWKHAIFWLLVLLGAPGTRPSHVKEDGRSDGDIAVLRGRVKSQPMPFVGLWILLLGAFVIASFTEINWFWLPLQWVWAIAVTGIFIAVLGSLWWWTVYQNSRIKAWASWIPVVAAIILQVFGRMTDLPIWAINGASLAAWICLAVVLAKLVQKSDVYSRF
jgi:hypothetical protein